MKVGIVSEPNTKEWFVAVVRGPKMVLVLGPYTTRGEADANVERGHEKAIASFTATAFDGRATVAMEPGNKSLFGV